MRIKSPISNALFFRSDMPDEYIDRLIGRNLIAFDLETSGLNWQKDRIATCQLFAPPDIVMVIRITKSVPKNINIILNSNKIQKLFHHAMFDLRFMLYHWQTEPRNIACTKISAKLLDKENKYRNSLKDLLKRYLNVEINKKQRTSNWFKNLSQEQKLYVIKDVIYLPDLFHALMKRLADVGLNEFANEAFTHIPTRVKLDLLGYKDIYLY